MIRWNSVGDGEWEGGAAVSGWGQGDAQEERNRRVDALVDGVRRGRMPLGDRTEQHFFDQTDRIARQSHHGERAKVASKIFFQSFF